MLGAVTKELFDIIHQTQLRLYLNQRTLLRTAGMQEQLRLHIQVRDLILLLVVRHRILRVTQFSRYNRQTLFDERSRVGSNHILIHHRIQVVLLNDLMQQRLVAFRCRRFDGQRDDVRLFLMLRHFDLMSVSGYH